jgi:hypothetical protein
MTGGPFESPDMHRIVILFPQTDEGTREVPLWLSRIAARQNSGGAVGAPAYVCFGPKADIARDALSKLAVKLSVELAL